MASTVRQCITLKGSTEIVAEFFDYAINSILYQRGIFPPETFTHKQQYGLTLLVTTNDELLKYLKTVIGQVKNWCQELIVQKLVVVIKRVDTNEVVERWQFDIQCDKTVNSKTKRDKTEKEVKEEIKSIIRQITATVTFLPLLESVCSFDVLIYTDKDAEVPFNWGESGPHFITNSEEVRLRSFTTTIHKVDAMVAFKKTD
ncbi:mitotic spindle assembly checkpoint protein MAD2A-like [Littorina saxatilis]|uniref:Mitotic spindle assembly checkpoint protein MAD2A n=1 Tax=Littorina saxatilis TaxID=31220 RepID=A0AAN9BXG8_9CAEN